jgi:DivIVA domain-containing protein
MPTSDLDVPLLPSAEQIRRREFATIRRGYDPDQVRDYLESVAIQVESLEKDLKDARLEAGSRAAQPPAMPVPAAPESDPYERISQRFAGLLATADREASRIVDEAKTEADRIRVDAQSNAEAAKQEGSEALESARDEADRVLAGLSARRETLVGQLQEMQSRLLGVAKDLETVIDEPDAAALETDVDADAEIAAEGPSGTENADAEADELLDPRYEDLWVSTEGNAASTEAEVQFEDLFADAETDAEDDTGDAVATEAGAVDDADQMDLPDLSSIELDFEEDRPDTSD